MVSNEDRDEKKRTIPLTGIEVMNNLQIDARKLLYLAHEDILKPFIPEKIDKRYIMLCMNARLSPPESFCSGWMYRKSEVEEFKSKNEDLWNELRQPSLGERGIDGDRAENDQSKSLDSKEIKKGLTPPFQTTGCLLRESSSVWRIGYEGMQKSIKHLNGLLYIGYLLEKPGVPISCRDLYHAGSGKTPEGVTSEDRAMNEDLYATHTKQPASDDKAKKDYWGIWKKLQDEIDNAENSPEGELIKEENKKRQAEIEPYLKERVFIDPNDKKAQINIHRRLQTVYKAIEKAGMKNMAKYLRSNVKPDGKLGLIYTGSAAWEIVINK